MVYYPCLIKSSGSGGGGTSGLPVYIFCGEQLAGETITCTDGTTTLEEICPSQEPYTTQFNIPYGGTWEVSGYALGQLCATSFTINDAYSISLVPNGKIATPNDVQTWLNCASIFDLDYSTVSEVLADTNTLSTLISNHNSADYMARSTTFAPNVCANETAMTYIGNDNYCADETLASIDWRTAICNSTYFEQVLNVKVPAMTDIRNPSGEATASYTNGGYSAWRAFDRNVGNTSFWSPPSTVTENQWIKYDFGYNVKIYKVSLTNAKYTSNSYTWAKDCAVEYSTNDSNFITVKTFQNSNTASYTTDVIVDNVGVGRYWRVFIYNIYPRQVSYATAPIDELQFYGRRAV